MRIILILLYSLICLNTMAQDIKKPVKEPVVYECVRWRYKDFIKYEVECLEYRIKDCSKRLYKNICRLGA